MARRWSVDRKKQPVVRVLKSGGQLHVWFCPDGKP
jgi:hypothetical protein